MQRQLAIKLVFIFVVSLLLLIPTSMVAYKVEERQNFASQARGAVSQSWTGEQKIITPFIVIPYQTETTPSVHPTKNETAYTKHTPTRTKYLTAILPNNLQINAEIKNHSLYKGIYEVPVYNSDITLTGKFNPETIQEKINHIKQQPEYLSMGTPFITLYISDMRGIDKTPTFHLNEKTKKLTPGSKILRIPSGLHTPITDQTLLNTELSFTLNLSLRGTGKFSFIPLGEETKTHINSNWPHPEFVGSSLPKQRKIQTTGFNATWSDTQYSSQGFNLVNPCIASGDCNNLLTTSSGINFIQPVNIYLQTERAIKYALLFIGLSFITFFIFENIKKIKIHPIQYTFVGLAISIFYLLLISLAEHIAFYWAYSIAATCCSLLLLFYVRYILKKFLTAFLFFIMILGLYSLLYVIIQAEDFALLMGAVLVFVILSVLMYVTRNIDWYSINMEQ